MASRRSAGYRNVAGVRRVVGGAVALSPGSRDIPRAAYPGQHLRLCGDRKYSPQYISRSGLQLALFRRERAHCMGMPAYALSLGRRDETAGGSLRANIPGAGLTTNDTNSVVGFSVLAGSTLCHTARAPSSVVYTRCSRPGLLFLARVVIAHPGNLVLPVAGTGDRLAGVCRAMVVR